MARLSRNQLKTPIEILRSIATTNDYGEPVDGEPSVVSTVFCEWLPISANAAITGKVQNVNITAKLYVDIETDIQSTDKIRLIETSQTYTVASVMPVPADKKIMVLCEQK